MSLLHGIIAILPTPFDEVGEVDEESLRRVVGYLIEQGVHGVAAPALASEGYKLNETERRQVIRSAVESAGGRVPVVAATGHEGTREAAELSREALPWGPTQSCCCRPAWGSPGYEPWRITSWQWLKLLASL